MRVELLGAASLPPRSFTRRLGATGWLVQTPAAEMLVLGEDLVEQTRFPLPSTWRGAHWVTPDHAFAAVSERDRVLLVDRRGQIIWASEHHPWGGRTHPDLDPQRAA